MKLDVQSVPHALCIVLEPAFCISHRMLNAAGCCFADTHIAGVETRVLSSSLGVHWSVDRSVDPRFFGLGTLTLGIKHANEANFYIDNLIDVICAGPEQT